MKRSSGGRPAPLPAMTARTPLRSIFTGITWSLSVTSVTSAMYGNTRVTCPTTPSASTTADPGTRPASRPLSTTSFCVNASRPL